MKPQVLAGIFARGGSKGVPRKNLRVIAGKPLIAHAIDVARRSALITRVFVSTDDAEIAAIAVQYGAEVPFMRPAELARDDSPEWLAWQHALRSVGVPSATGQWDAFVSIPTTSPLRSVDDVDACIRSLLAGDADVAVTVRASARSPYFNMVTLDEQGYARLVIQPSGDVWRRQEAPTVFDITTVAYAARPAFVLSASSMFQGRVRGVLVPDERALDIDTPLDLRIAEFLMAERTGRER